MGRHGYRNAYYILDEGVFQEPAYLSADGHACPVARAAAKPAACSPFKFGRMFARARCVNAGDGVELFNGLIRLGLCMDNPAKYCKGAAVVAPGDSTIPSGYTYLGQFIAHEITFDNAQDLPAVEPDPQDLRSPSIDLDSLYGAGPRDEDSRQFYEDDSIHLKVGQTHSPPPPPRTPPPASR
jgi:hypothetical protein